MVALGLAGVAEDERGAEGGVRLGGPDVGDAAQEALAVAPAAHAGEQRARHVLEREVEVGHARVEDGLDQLVGQAGRVEVEQPGALDPRPTTARVRAAMGDGPLAMRVRRPGPDAVAAVGGEVLGDEDDLAQRRRAGRRARGARRPRPGPPRASGSAACPGRTGWRRSRRCGRSPRPPSRRPTGRGRRGGAARGGRSRGSSARRRGGAGRAEGDRDGVERRAAAWSSGRGRSRPRGRPRAGRRAARRRSARPCSRSRRGVRPSRRRSARLRTVSIDSWRAASMKAQVLTTTRSAASGSAARSYPCAAR